MASCSHCSGMPGKICSSFLSACPSSFPVFLALRGRIFSHWGWQPCRPACSPNTHSTSPPTLPPHNPHHALLWVAFLIIGKTAITEASLDFVYLTRFRRTSDGEVIPGPEHGFDIVGGYFSADLKSSISHSLNMHFPITQSSMAFLKIKVMLFIIII